MHPALEVTAFSGQPFSHQLTGVDPDGTEPFFRLGSAPPNVTMTHDGRLSGTLYGEHDFVVDVALFDECDRTTYIKVKVCASRKHMATQLAFSWEFLVVRLLRYYQTERKHRRTSAGFRL